MAVIIQKYGLSSTHELLYTLLKQLGGTLANIENKYHSTTDNLLYAIINVVANNGTGGSSGGNATINNAIPVHLLNGKTLGKYTNGQTINPANATITLAQLIEDLATELPNAAPPSASLSSNQPTGNIEIGTTLSIILATTFTQNNAGALQSTTYYKNGNALASNTDSLLVSANAANYAAIIAYNAGVANPSAYNGSIAAGSIQTNIITYTGAYKNFFGNSANVPGTSNDVRNLASTFANQFELNTGTTNKNFIVNIPSGKSIVSVIDLDALNLNITAEYIQQSFSVNDAAGTPYTTNLYIKTNGVAYSANHRHLITIQ